MDACCPHREPGGARPGARGRLPLLLLLASLVAACEYPGVAHPMAAAAPAPRLGGAPAAKPAPAGERASSRGGGEQAPVLQGTVPMLLKDFELQPDALAVKAGSVTFVLKNDGRYTHDFRVEGQGVDLKGPKVGSGRSTEWRIALQPGTYRISCPVSNHADRGMAGTLTVVP